MSERVLTKEKAVARITEWKVLEPFLTDYRARFHGRQLADLLKMNHGTVALTLKRLEGNNILKAEQEGRNKKYYLNLDNFLTKGYIRDVESAKTTTYIRKHFLFKKLLSEFPPPDFMETPVILFGSYAKGSYTKESDIDILILDTSNAKKIIKALKEFGERHDKRMQIQKMTQASFEKGLRERDTLVLEVVKDHIILNNIPVMVDILWRYYNAVR